MMTRHSVIISVTLTSCTDASIACDRSNNVWICTDAGSWGPRSAIVCFTAPATATVLVPGCRWIASTMARVPSNQLAVLLSWTSSSTLATSCNRTGAPFLYATTSWRNSGALWIWPSARTVYARCGPHNVPVGTLGLPASTAAATSSMPMPRDTRACGSTWIRTAYFCDPYTCTCATPSTVEMCWARNVSAYSSSADNDSVGELTAMKRIGESAGFTFW